MINYNWRFLSTNKPMNYGPRKIPLGGKMYVNTNYKEGALVKMSDGSVYTVRYDGAWIKTIEGEK